MYIFRICITISLIFSSLFTLARVPQWDWRAVDLNNIQLPAIRGTSVSEYQVSGSKYCPHSNWAHWEAQKVYNGKPTIQHNDWSGSL